VTNAGGVPAAVGVMNGSRSSAIHCPSPGSAGAMGTFIGAGGQPTSGSVNVGASAGVVGSPSSSCTSCAVVPCEKRAFHLSSAVNATAFTHCIRSSPNQGIARTRSTDQVTTLPGRAFASGTTRTHDSPETARGPPGSITIG
jgi:hypothetical protein